MDGIGLQEDSLELSTNEKGEKIVYGKMEKIVGYKDLGDEYGR